MAFAAIAAAAASASAQSTPAPAPAPGTASFTVFTGTSAIGSEEMTVTRTGDGWQVTSNGRQRGLTINDFRLTLAADWHPRELRIDAVLGNQAISSTTTFGVTTAVTDYLQNGRRASVTHQISARTIVLPNAFYAPYEVMAARLGTAAAGTTFKVFIVPQTEIEVIVKSVGDQKVVTTSGTVSLKRYELVAMNPGGELPITVDVDSRSRLARIVIPSAQLSVVRDDLSSVSSRPVTYRNPGDEDVFVPALGFNLAATITKPAQMSGRVPAIVLIGGSASTDRDETVSGVPLFGELAGQLAAAGYMVLRYDKRGLGQSGGRPEAATLTEYAADAQAAVAWLAKRKDVDKNRIAIVGHNEGAAVALLAARDKKIKAAVLISGAGTTGYELILEQQRRALDALALPPAEREARIALQRKLMDAAVTGKGWEGVPVQLRASADSPWFRSMLLFDPAMAMKNVKQPLLVIGAREDTQVPAHHADKLAALANLRKKAAPATLVTLERLAAEVRVAPAVSDAIVNFLKQALTLR